MEESVETSLRQLASQYYCQQEYVPPLNEIERQWGMLPMREYADIFEKTILNQCLRRFEAHGVDLSGIWLRVKSGILGA